MRVKKSPEDLIGTKEAGRDLGISASRVCALIVVGKLPARRISHAYIIRRGDLELVRERPVGRPKKP